MIRLKPWLWLSPSLAHMLSPVVLNCLGLFSNSVPAEWQAFEWRGIRFPNRLGIAGGVDKDAINVHAWWKLGAGFLEVGTVTPRPQSGNSPPVIDRDSKHRALWNRLGFPSQGVARIKNRLLKLRRPFPAPIFINIGKNAATPLEEAGSDYKDLLRELEGTVDGFVINISSPNTRGLRDLLRPDRLRSFLEPIMRSLPNRREPILLKLSPDLSDEELESALKISDELGIDGWVLTNTSQGLREGLSFPDDGGISGRPLAGRSREFLSRTLKILGPRRDGKLIVSVGGVMSVEDVRERLTLGADLVQVYSALIFDGPFFFRKVAQWQLAHPTL